MVIVIVIVIGVPVVEARYAAPSLTSPGGVKQATIRLVLCFCALLNQALLTLGKVMVDIHVSISNTSVAYIIELLYFNKYLDIEHVLPMCPPPKSKTNICVIYSLSQPYNNNTSNSTSSNNNDNK